jgi:hypothetical protein
MTEIIKVPSIGAPAWEGEITDNKLEQVIGGLLIPNQAFAKALAMELRRTRAENARLKAPISDEEAYSTVHGEGDRRWIFLTDMYALIGARAAGKGLAPSLDKLLKHAIAERDAEWEKAIQEEGDRISWQGFGAETSFAKAVRARLDRLPEPTLQEKVEKILKNHERRVTSHVALAAEIVAALEGK